MTFADFCRTHGLLIDSLEHGRWVRVPTVDHPRKRNGAYKFMGDIGWAQNHATDAGVSTWRHDRPAQQADSVEIAKKAREFERQQSIRWQRAAEKAAELIKQSKLGEHNYLHFKGLHDHEGMVCGDDLIVPMRHYKTNAVVGAQLIRWIPDEMKYMKKMLPGMRAKGAVFRIGNAHAKRTWLVEGYVTGLSVEAALQVMRLRDSVLVCFSAGNLVHVASLLGGERLVFADNDASQAGELAAKTTGLRYCMSGTVGHDANDMHQKEGIFRVASLMMDAINSEESAVATS